MSSSPFDRSDYPTLTESIYLNQASLGLIGRPAVDAMHRLIDGIARHGNLHMSDDDEVNFLDALRGRAARLFQTEAHQIAILSSASELLGQIPLMLPPSFPVRLMSLTRVRIREVERPSGNSSISVPRISAQSSGATTAIPPSAMK